MYVCMYVWMYVDVCMYVCMWMYVCMYVIIIIGYIRLMYDIKLLFLFSYCSYTSSSGLI